MMPARSPHRRSLVALAGTFLALSLLALAAPASGEDIKGTVTGLSCTSGQSQTFCTGYLAGFDGTALDVDLAVPNAGLYPLVVVVHGWGGSKGDANPSTGYPGDDFFTSHGYAVMRYSTRGFGKSWGQTHLASLDWEIKDLQALVSQVVDDARVRVIPTKIGVTGASYGGGHSWLIATRPQWQTPNGTTVRVAAVAPIVPWTDLIYSLLPNGRPDDSTAVVGTSKWSYVAGLYLGGIRYDPSRPYPNYDPFLTESFVRINQGEPYEADGIRDPIVQKGFDEFTKLHSVAWQKEWIASLKNKANWVPVLELQGWTDDLFPVTEALRMWRLIKAVAPSYPIKLYFGDIGHPRAANKTDETQAVLSMLGQWFDYWLKGAGPKPSFDVTAATTTPDTGFHPDLVVRVSDPAKLATGTKRFQVQGPFELVNPTTQPGGTVADPILGVIPEPLGPIINALRDPLAPALVQSDSAVPGGGAVVSKKVADLTGGSPLWYFGQGSVSFTGAVVGTDAQYDVRLWDRAPDGTYRLVDRGSYKFLGLPGTVSVSVPLFGNAWLFPPDHQLLVEVSNVDAPYLRPDNIPSSTVIDWITVSLPVRRTT